MAWSVRADSIRGSTGAITPAYPTGWAQDDISIIVIETTASNTVTTPTGYTPHAANPQTASGTRLWAFWRRMVTGDVAPTIADPGDHMLVQLFMVRGAVTSGNPFRTETGGNVASSATADFLAASANGGDLAFLVNGHAASTGFTFTGSTNLQHPAVTQSPLIGGQNAGGSTTQGNDGSFAIVIGAAQSTANVDAAGTWGTAGAQTQLSMVLIPATSYLETSRVGLGIISGHPSNAVRTARVGIGVIIDTLNTYVPPTPSGGRRRGFMSCVP